MTAIVGVLNRRGLAFAADSAATLRTNSGCKILNNANKIFTLSRYHPVGIAIFNDLDFLGTPWDSIIKQFRDSLKNKKYDTLQGYVKPFFQFVKSYCLDALSQEQQDYMNNLTGAFYNEIISKVVGVVGNTFNDTNADYFFKVFLECLKDEREKIGAVKADDFVNYKISDFEKYAEICVTKILSAYTSQSKCPSTLKKEFTRSLYYYICQKKFICINNFFTGLVFFGYGDKDLFPSVYEYIVTYAIDNHIKYTCEYKYNITSASGSSLIVPFAQADVANTVVRAVEDKLRQKFYDTYKATLMGFRDEIVMQLVAAKAPNSFVDIFNNLNIDKYTQNYRNGMDDYIDKSYIRPLMETVAFLEKEDLADMAESLVRMTCLKRHVTVGEETVGGPVDVAIVTKGDGFIWKKRKHYFEPELNSQFFERNK